MAEQLGPSSNPRAGSGFIVETYDGKIGRTFNEKSTLGEKVIVHLEVANHYDTNGTLYNRDQIKIIGFID